MGEEPQRWTQFLHLVEFWYSTTFHSSIAMSPFEALYRKQPPTIPSYLTRSTKIATLDEFLAHRQSLLAELKTQLSSVRHRMKQVADRHRREVVFEVGDWVHLRLQPYRQVSVAHRRIHKLSRHYYGPFQVLKRIGPVVYLLDLPPTTKIHPVFHVSMLRPCKGRPEIQSCPLPLHSHGSHPLLTPLCIQGRHTLASRQGPVEQVLVQWTSQSEDEATWEDPKTILEKYHDMDLVDKVILQGEGVDTPQLRPNSNVANDQAAVDNNNPNTRPKRSPVKPQWMLDYQTYCICLFLFSISV